MRISSHVAFATIFNQRLVVCHTATVSCICLNMQDLGGPANQPATDLIRLRRRAHRDRCSRDRRHSRPIVSSNSSDVFFTCAIGKRAGLQVSTIQHSKGKERERIAVRRRVLPSPPVDAHVRDDERASSRRRILPRTPGPVPSSTAATMSSAVHRPCEFASSFVC